MLLTNTLIRLIFIPGKSCFDSHCRLSLLRIRLTGFLHPVSRKKRVKLLAIISKNVYRWSLYKGWCRKYIFFYLTMRYCLKKTKKPSCLWVEDRYSSQRKTCRRKKKRLDWCLFCRSFPHSHTYITPTLALEGWKKKKNQCKWKLQKFNKLNLSRLSLKSDILFNVSTFFHLEWPSGFLTGDTVSGIRVRPSRRQEAKHFHAVMKSKTREDEDERERQERGSWSSVSKTAARSVSITATRAGSVGRAALKPARPGRISEVVRFWAR